MIIVTGAHGRLGSRTVRRLLDRVPADRIGVSVRDTDGAADLAALGVRVRRGDFADPASLSEAFEGATQVLVVSAPITGPVAIARHTAAADAAVAAGAKRVLYTSHQGASPDSLFAPMPSHAATERYLAGTGTPFTALRNGYYASTIPLLLGQALRTGELVAPADGPVSWTAHDDLAEATAVILADEGRFDGPTPPLTAPHALDLAGIAGILGELTGRTIRRVVADDAEWAAGLVGNGVPQERADMLLGMFHASRRGEFAATGPALTELLGRDATPVRAVLEEVVAAG
ncbi:NmrA family NAD(P)-binding protein [Streptomyces corynorhini]|uniref:NAD-dependent epimerase/dehydratase family protein n=1 Tax=Streptomyces corynorhini TaxID=2282652 RepID=A0A370B341_9ACTN|nr:NAD(P)H-binding protein [Streptomyces corynorhini]RDG34494.1 NAD-dependent epimerase/dehydratase family protein [Streptomyces corynorhini]